MADGAFPKPTCCASCEAIGAAPHGLLGCGDCDHIRFLEAIAKHEAELQASLNAQDEFPYSVWLEWCALGEDPEAPTRKQRRQDREDARDYCETERLERSSFEGVRV